MKVIRKVKVRVEDESIMVGDQINIKLSDGTKHTATAISKTHDEDGLRIKFVFDNCICRKPINEMGGSAGGFKASTLANYLHSDFYYALPEKLRKRMVKDDEGNYLSLPSLTEVCGCDDKWNNCEGQLEYFKDRRHKIACVPGEEDGAYWWLRDVVSASYFASIAGTGLAYPDNASDANGVRPAFTIKVSGSLISRPRAGNDQRIKQQRLEV